MTRLSQTDMILDALQRGHVVSPVVALREFGCFRLAARVHELRARGNDIRVTEHPDGYALYFMPPAERLDPLHGDPALAENEQRMLWGDR